MVTSEVSLLLLAAAEVAVEPHDGQVHPVTHIRSHGEQPHKVITECVLDPRATVA
jgi:hypothetical protein